MNARKILGIDALHNQLVPQPFVQHHLQMSASLLGKRWHAWSAARLELVYAYLTVCQQLELVHHARNPDRLAVLDTLSALHPSKHGNLPN